MAVDLLTNVIIGGQTTSGFNALAGRLETLGTTVDRIGSSIREFEKDSVEVYRGYEDNMLAAEYALSAQYTSASQLDKIMQELDEHASSWAANSIFHTSDVSRAINEASHAGWDYTKMVQGIPQAMLIAQAGSLNLSTGLDYLVKMMNATETEFGSIGTVVDQWSKAANISATNIGEMGEAFMSMGAAAQFGDSTAELFTLLAVLANVGTTGSQAGTALRSAMMRIIAPTAKADDAMELLGADAEELEEVLSNVSVTKAAETLKGLGFTAYTEQGKLKPVIDIFTDLHTALTGLDEASQNEILAAIFPTRTIAQAKAFLAAIGNGKMAEIFTAIGDSEGYAAKGAETMNSGLTGSIEMLTSKWEEFQRSAGKTLAPAIENMAGGLGDITDAINGMDEAQLSALVGGITAIAAAGPTLKIAGGAIRLFTTLGPWGTAFVVAAVSAGALTGYLTKLNEINFKENFGAMALDMDTLGEHVDSLKTKFDAQQDAISAYEGALAKQQETYAAKSSELSELLLTDVLTGKELTPDEIKTLSGYADDVYQAVWSGLYQAEKGDKSFLDAIFGDHENLQQEEVGNTAEQVVESWYDSLYGEAYDIGQELRQQMSAALLDKNLDETERQAIQSSLDRYNQIMAEIQTQMDTEAYYEQLYKAQNVSWDSIDEYMTENAKKQEADLAALDEAYAVKYGDYAAAYRWAINNDKEVETLDGSYRKVTEADFAALDEQLDIEKEKARQSIIDKYGQLDAAAFDALMNDSEFSTGWNYLKWMQQNGVNLYDENGNLNWREMGLTPELATVLGDQLDGLANLDSSWGDLGRGKLTEILKPFADNPTIASYIKMLENSRGIGLNIDDYRDRYENYQFQNLDPYNEFSTEEERRLRDKREAAQRELDTLNERLDRINADIGAAEDRLAGKNRPLFYSLTGGEQTDWDMLYGNVVGGNLTEQKKQVELDITAAEAELAKLEEEANAMNPSLTVTAEVDSSAVDNYSPGSKFMKVIPFVVGQAYAEGGRAEEPSIFGEAGPEWAIPEEHTQRTAELLNAAREASGFTWGDLISRYGGLNANPRNQSVVITYSPTINAQNADGVERVLAEDKARLLKLVKDMLAEQRMRDEVEVYA